VTRGPVRGPAAGASEAPCLRFRIRVTQGEAIAIGPGRVALLEAIERTGSLTAAALETGMSYRRAWTLLDALNAALREPAVHSAQGGAAGGGSALTPTGRELVRRYRAIEARATRAAAKDIQVLMALLGPSGAPPSSARPARPARPATAPARPRSGVSASGLRPRPR
jgi:molybdate transport system regulatory protein